MKYLVLFVGVLVTSILATILDNWNTFILFWTMNVYLELTWDKR